MILLPDAAASRAFGASLAPLVEAGDVVTLAGPLGAGKTSIARGLLAALGFAGEVPSPSFAIVQPYEPPEIRLPIMHVDLYRIGDVAEMAELGLDDVEDAVMLIEWPEHAAGWWPDALALTLATEPGGGRRLTAEVPLGWRTRWPLR